MANSNTESESENLSRIRDILFGEDLQSIEQKLDSTKDEQLLVVDTLKQEIINLNNKIESSIEEFGNKFSEFKKSINETIFKIKEEHELKINELSSNKLDKGAMADILTELAQKLKK